MGNHHSSSQGKYDFPNPTCILKPPDCFGRSSGTRSGLDHDNNTRLNAHPRPARSLSFRHESRTSNNSSTSPSKISQYTAFANGKGRRSSVDSFPETYQGGEIKKSKAHKLPSQKNNSNSTHRGSPSTCLTTPSSQQSQSQTPRGTLECPEAGGRQGTVDSDSSATAANSKEEGRIRIVAANKLCMMNSSLEKFAKQLSHMSRSLESSPGKPFDDNTVSRSVFQKHVASHSVIGEEYVWDFFRDYNEKSSSLKSSAFVQGAEKLFAPITDKEQINFYVKLYGKGKSAIDRNAFIDLLISAYQLSSPNASKAGRDLNNSKDFAGKEWIESVAKSCFHIKEEMSVCFVSNWILTNIPRLLIPMHKYYVHQLTAGYNRLCNLKESSSKQDQRNEEGAAVAANSEDPASDNEIVKGINPILMWLLISSLPPIYVSAFTKKADPQQQVKLLNRMNSSELLLKLLHANDPNSNQWTLLYDGANQGLSINRFQYHVFSYKGPTLMFITCDNDYTLLVGIDTEWKENCHFWGGEQCFIIQLKPEFHVVEVGGKSLYANFSIRGYPFGIQAGKDPRNVAVEIKPDFEYVYFKKIPCRIISLTVWGCAPPQAKAAQTEHKQWEAKQSEKQKKININSGEWNDNPDKYLLELAGNYRSYGNGN